jgi:hypothetical protein
MPALCELKYSREIIRIKTDNGPQMPVGLAGKISVDSTIVLGRTAVNGQMAMFEMAGIVGIVPFVRNLGANQHSITFAETHDTVRVELGLAILFENQDTLTEHMD